MRILLAQNSLYYPAHGGGDKSNRLLIEGLAERGHECRVVARIGAFGLPEHERFLVELAAREVTPRSTTGGVVTFERAGVEVHTITATAQRPYFASQVQAFRPDVIVTSTDDPAQQLLDVALRSGVPVVYLVRATIAVPFGPDASLPNEARTARLRDADLVVGVSQYVADYVRRHAGIDAVHVPISLMGPGDWPDLGRFDNEFVTMVNPCTVKGISIFLALADAFPQTAFAAVPMWGTNQQDRAALIARPNITLLKPVDDIDDLLARTRVMLMPSLWAEARSRIVLEAMLRGVPDMAADVGGMSEAKMGVPYLLPVNPILQYRQGVDERMVPQAEAPPQDTGPWRDALARLLRDRAHYEEIARASRAAALRYAESLTAAPFEKLLLDLPKRDRRPQPNALPAKPPVEQLSPEKRRLLALRLRQRAPASAWFPALDASAKQAPAPRLFWFPHAGGGTGQAPAVAGDATVVPVRLPGRESRIAEAPFARMGPLVEALAAAIEPYLDRPFAFFGHSMGAIVGFELARVLRRRGLPMPKMLIASAARAPQFRRNHIPATDPTDDQLIDSLEGPERELFQDAAVRRAMLPALRADASLYRHYVYEEDAPFDFPIGAYGGAGDANVRLEHLEGWGRQTTGPFAVRVFPGGHFYLQASRQALPEGLTEALAEDLAAVGL